MKIDAGGEMMFQKREENGVKGGDEWRSVEAGRKKAGAEGKRNSRKKEEKSNEKKNFVEHFQKIYLILWRIT